MKQVDLGVQGLMVSAQGLGCMGMSATYGPSNEQENLATLARALELGVTFFDTAEVYGPHLNEELLGRYFAGWRSKVVLATKVGVKFGSDGKLGIAGGKPMVSGEPAYVRAAVEGSLRRLKTDYVDLLYLHRIDPIRPSKTQSVCSQGLWQRAKFAVLACLRHLPTLFERRMLYIRSVLCRPNTHCSSAAWSETRYLLRSMNFGSGLFHILPWVGDSCPAT